MAKDPFSTQPVREKVNPNQVIGKIPDGIEIIDEGPVLGSELKGLNEWPELKVGKMAARGSLSFNSRPTISTIENPEPPKEPTSSITIPEPVSQVASEVFGFVSHAFEPIPDLFADTANALGKDLIVNQILGFGGAEKKEGQNLSPQEQAQRAEKLADAKQARFEIQRGEDLAARVTQEEQIRRMNEMFRINEKREATQEDANLLGINSSIDTNRHLQDAYSVHSLYRKRVEMKEAAQRKEDDTKLAPAAPTVTSKGAISGGEIDLNRRFENRKGDNPG